MIAETGSIEYGGSKAAWIADALARTPDPFRGLVQLGRRRPDSSIESLASARAAFAAEIADPADAGSDFGALAGAPIGG